MHHVLLLLLLVPPALSLEFQCRDQSNKPVDWFVFYKIPRLKNEWITDPHILNGTGFIYLDSNKKEWTLSETGMESNTQAIGYTLQQYYDNQHDPSIISIFYSDQLPYPQNGTWSSYHGHSKGLIVFSTTNGFWLIHSIPKFPRNDTYDYPSNAHYYGQSGICLSMEYSALKDIATQLFYSRLFIYSSTLPASVAAEIPTLAKVVAEEYQREKPYTSIIPLTTSAGQVLVHFAKTGDFGKDLYFDLVAPSLHVSLKVQTWQHESSTNENLNSWCRPPNVLQVFNSKVMTLPFGVNFTNYYDHSKYAVATTWYGGIAAPWVCIGDINRQTHQLERAGGTMCVLDASLYKAYQNVISEYWPCKDGE